MGRLIIDGNSVYEIDEECERRKMQVQNGKDRGNRKCGHKKRNDLQKCRGKRNNDFM